MRASLQSSGLTLALMAMPIIETAAAEKVLGAYIFARHGDRTAKVFSHTQLTDLGYHEVFLAGSYYNGRYISSNSSLQIAGISDAIVNPSQISASAPADAVLQNSGTGFLQGVYPPVGTVASQTLGNGSTVEAPLNGYQLIPLSLAESGSNSENNAWLQDTTECQKAEVSSNSYYSSTLYNSLLKSTSGFFTSLAPVLDGAFSSSQMNFKNAYTIFDYLNVGYIHNQSTQLDNALTDEVRLQLQVLANIHEYDLAYNESDPVRAIAGAQLAGEVLDALNTTITSQGKSKLTFQFGAYGTFLSYFGLAQLPAASDNFTGIPDYASSMVWELVTNSTSNGFPSASEISVRFLYHNGTITGSDTPAEYPLFNQSATTVPWSEFVSQTQKFAITSDDQWCQMCGNTDGQCASGSNSSSASATAASSSGSGGMSLAVAGVIGAMVTLAVILGLEALVLLAGGFRIAKKGKSTPTAAAAATAAAAESKGAAKV